MVGYERAISSLQSVRLLGMVPPIIVYENQDSYPLPLTVLGKELFGGYRHLIRLSKSQVTIMNIIKKGYSFFKL